MLGRRTHRSGYTLIELLAAMVAATLLLASLAATISITTNLLEAPADDAEAWRDREIYDRIAADLRYSTFVDDTPADGFTLTKANVSTGANETASYQVSSGGLMRQIDSGLTILLEDETPTHTFSVDRYEAPNSTANTSKVRVRSTNTTTVSGPVGSMTCDLPLGCQDGDIIMMFVAARSPTSVSISPTGWGVIHFVGFGDQRLLTLFRIYDSASSATVQITFNSGNATAAVAMVALENAATGDPFNWASTRGGVAWSTVPSTHPSPHEPSTGTEPFHGNLQVLAARENPWPNNTMGLASFSDVIRATSGSGTSTETSIGVTFRNGTTPALTTTPRFWQQTSGIWIQNGVRVGNGG